MEISLCMIVKNEEDVLARCLNSVKDFVDEIVIVDTGSSDKTKSIAKQFTELVYDFEWCDDFSKARNYAFSLGTKDFLMWLDADDIMKADDLEEFLKIKELLKDYDMAVLPYHVAFDSFGNPTMSYERERIFARNLHYEWMDPIHEVIAMSGRIYHGLVGVYHKKLKVNDSNRNLRIFEKMIQEGKKMNARQTFYYSRELYDHARYSEAETSLENYLKRSDAWVQNKIDACKILANCKRALNKPDEILPALFYSFTIALPQGELLCEIAAHFMSINEFQQAIYWYEQASKVPLNMYDGGFHFKDCYDFIPYLQLCVCYDKLGDHQKAAYYNKLAGEIKPESEAYLSNLKYFESLHL